MHIPIQNCKPYKKVFSKRLLKTLLIVLNIVLVSNSYSQAYVDYEDSNNIGKLSFEGIPAYYVSQLRTTRGYLKTLLKEDLNSNFITEAVVNYRVLKKQIKYLEREEFNPELIRICDSTFHALPIQSQKKHVRIIAHLEKKYAISPAEYKVLKSSIVFSRNEASDHKLKKYIDTFEEYVDLAFELKYSKLEIFRDCTGYWKPESILHKTSFRDVLKACMNWKHFENIYRNPFDYTSTTSKHGLKTNEAVRRLRDIKTCTTECAVIEK